MDVEETAQMQTLNLELVGQSFNPQSYFFPCTVRIIVFPRSFEMMAMKPLAHSRTWIKISRSPFWLSLLVNNHLLAIQSNILIYGVISTQNPGEVMPYLLCVPFSSMSAWSALFLCPHFSCWLYHWCVCTWLISPTTLGDGWGWELGHLFWGPQCIAMHRAQHIEGAQEMFVECLNEGNCPPPLTAVSVTHLQQPSRSRWTSFWPIVRKSVVV